MYKTLISPLSVQIELTDNCNQTCGHCYRSCQTSEKRNVAYLDELGMIRIMDELTKNKVFSVIFTGGEPLMRQEILKIGIRKAAEAGMEIDVNTNLQLLNDDLIQFFKEYDVEVLTSILSNEAKKHDGIAKKDGAHKKLIKNITRLTERGVPVMANMVVRSDNASQVYNTGALVYDLGVRQFSATKVAPSPGTDYASYRSNSKQIISSLDMMLDLNRDLGLRVEILESYPFCFFEDIEKYAMFAKRNCTAGIINCSIGPKGNVRPCSHAPMAYGNIFIKSFRECWLAMQDWRDGVFLNEVCKNCEYVFQCSGGCRIDSLVISGNINGRDPLMTNPQKVKPTKVHIKNKPLPELLIFNPKLMLREEEFGGIIKQCDEAVFLSIDGYAKIKAIFQKGNSFNWRNVSVLSVNPTEMEHFFQVLIKSKMVLPA